MTTRRPLRVLLLEDNPHDAELISAFLQGDGFECDIKRVQTQAEFTTALSREHLDVILADYQLPSFDGLTAFRMALDTRPEVPFIFVSGTLGEEVAIEALKTGATDYVLKSGLMRLVPSVHRALGEAEDRAARKKAEQALRRSESYLAEAQRLSHTGTTVFDDKGPIYFSDESYRILGLDPRQGLPDRDIMLQLMHPDDRDRADKEFQAASREKRPYAIDLRIVLPDGTLKYIESTGHPLVSKTGGSAEILGTTVDVTERRRAQEEHERLRQLESELAHVNRLSIMGELAASLAHEILHPIATARNNARAALRFLDKSPPNMSEVRGALESIVRDADRGKAIVDRMRDHVKKSPPRNDRFDLDGAISEVIEMVRAAIDKHGVSVRTRFASDLTSVWGDRVQLQQVVMNLVLNAVEAMGSVDERARMLTVRTEQKEDSSILVAVHDSGPGIDPEHPEQVFKPFYTTKSSGVGMGLSICRSIVTAHGGRLWAEANQPRGAVFQFTLPAAEEDS